MLCIEISPIVFKSQGRWYASFPRRMSIRTWGGRTEDGKNLVPESTAVPLSQFIRHSHPCTTSLEARNILGCEGGWATLICVQL